MNKTSEKIVRFFLSQKEPHWSSVCLLCLEHLFSPAYSKPFPAPIMAGQICEIKNNHLLTIISITG